MNFSPILLFGAAVFTFVNSNVVSTEYDAVKRCPPPSNIAPCTCFKDPDNNIITAHCANFTNSYDLQAICDRNPEWELQEVWIDQCSLPFLPAKMFEEAYFQTINITSTSLLSLFDTPPVRTPELNIYMYDVKIMKGFQWKDIANSNLQDLMIFNMGISSFGQDFKDHIPKGVKRLLFDNTGTTSIKNQAFSNLENLKYLLIRHGSLKKLSRDFFPKPWNVFFLDFSYQKIAALPEDFFTDLPQLLIFGFEGNLLTTISERFNLFTNHRTLYSFIDNPLNCNCYMKWIVGTFDPLNLRGQCAEPESLRGRELKSLTDDNFAYCH